MRIQNGNVSFVNCFGPQVTLHQTKTHVVSGRPAGRSAGRPGGTRVVSGAEKKNYLIEAAPFGRLDQM